MKNSLFEQLSFRPGHVGFKGIRYMLIRPETIIGFQKAVEAEVGEEKCARMMVAGGIMGGSASLRSYGEALGYGEKDIVRFMCNMGCELGWGDFRLSMLDMKSRQLIVDVLGSPFAAAYGRSEKSVCHLIRGVLEGLGSSIFKRGVRSSETSCIAKGDEKCRFEIIVHKK